MNKLHAKSPCCNAVVYRCGGRRRQCRRCSKTWSIRLKKRGRKVKRIFPSINTVAFSSQESLRHKAKRLHQSREVIRKRHTRNISALLKKISKPEAPPGEIIAIVDAIACSFKKKPFTFYLILLRPISARSAEVMDPVLLEGCESVVDWQRAFGELPDETRKRIKAVVSDGLTGMDSYVLQQGWIYQRCHFHLLKTLQALRGKRWKNVPQKNLREKIYQLIRKLLEISDENEAERLIVKLRELSKTSSCPYWFGRRIRGCLKQWRYFRSYRMHPQLHIPTTTNSVESVNRLIKDTVHQTRGFRTSEPFRRWITLQIRTMPPIKCNGHNYQQN
jgi:hypothetical protein